MDTNKMKVVYTINERGERSFWTRIGVAYVNRDGSLNVKLDAVPVNGTMQVRDWTPRDDQPGAPQDRTQKGNGSRPPTESPGDGLPDAFS
jgi:hypothetical protein